LGSVRSPCTGLAWLPGGVVMFSEREVRLRRVSRDFQFGFGSSSKSGAIHRDVCVGPDGLVYTDRFAGKRFFRLEALRAFFCTYAREKVKYEIFISINKPVATHMLFF
jgi:hypothetical protein